MITLIGICSNRPQREDFTDSLIQLIDYESRHRNKDRGYIMGRVKHASLLPSARHKLLKAALQSKATHQLFLDDDSEIPPDIITRLAARNLDCVGANYIKKLSEKIHYVARGFDGKQVMSEDKTGVEEVAEVPLGATLIRLDAIRHIPPPWFDDVWDEKIDDYPGETTFFCKRLREHGVKMYVDHDLSALVGHIGDFTYKPSTHPTNSKQA